MLRSEGSTLHSMFISVIIVQRVPRAPSPELKRPKREADHSPPSSALVENQWSYTSAPSRALIVVVLKNREYYLHLTT